MGIWDNIPTELVSTAIAGAGVEAISVGASEEVLVLAVGVTFTADGTVATRNLSLRHRDTANTVILNAGGPAVTASASGAANYGAMDDGTPTNGTERFPIPAPYLMPASHDLLLNIANVQAGDTGNVYVLCKRRQVATS